MAVKLTPDDLRVFLPGLDDAMAQVLIKSTLARVAEVAPCINSDDLSEQKIDAAKGILLDLILRRLDVGSGAVEAETKGPWTWKYRDVVYRPGELAELQALCDTDDSTSDSALPVGCFPEASRDIFGCL